MREKLRVSESSLAPEGREQKRLEMSSGPAAAAVQQRGGRLPAQTENSKQLSMSTWTKFTLRRWKIETEDQTSPIFVNIEMGTNRKHETQRVMQQQQAGFRTTAVRTNLQIHWHERPPNPNMAATQGRINLPSISSGAATQTETTAMQIPMPINSTTLE